jgi:hypothetical protein
LALLLLTAIIVMAVVAATVWRNIAPSSDDPARYEVTVSNSTGSAVRGLVVQSAGAGIAKPIDDLLAGGTASAAIYDSAPSTPLVLIDSAGRKYVLADRRASRVETVSVTIDSSGSDGLTGAIAVGTRLSRLQAH